MTRFLERAALAVVLVAAACTTPADLLAQGDQERSEKRYDEAVSTYREVLDSKKTSPGERDRALEGLGKIHLERNMLDDAWATFQAISPTSLIRAKYLGRVAMLRGDRPNAEKFDREAYDHGERGQIVPDLAELVGGEASSPANLREAARILRGGEGDGDLATALDDAASVWEARDRGEAPRDLLEKLPSREKAPRYPVIGLLRADLLDAAGSHQEADAAYAELAAYEPKPTAAFLSRLGERRAASAIASGDPEALERALASGSLTQERAAAVRADLARSFEAMGDMEPALSLYRKSAQAGGPASALAFCDIARLEEARGRLQASAFAWTSAAAVADPGPEAKALLALERAREGDPLGARGPLEEARATGALDPELTARTTGALRAAGYVDRSIAALGSGDAAMAANDARAAVALEPSWRSAEAIAAAAEKTPTEDARADAAFVASAADAAPASGETRLALVSLKIVRLLGAGLVDDVVKAADPELAKDQDLAQAALATIVLRGPRAIECLLVAGDTPAASRLLTALKAHKLLAQAQDLVGRLRGDARFSALWDAGFTELAGPPDPLARHAPYACELVLADGTALGVVRTLAADPDGMDVVLPGRPSSIRIGKDRLAPCSARGVTDDEFASVDRAARERAGQ